MIFLHTRYKVISYFGRVKNFYLTLVICAFEHSIDMKWWVDVTEVELIGWQLKKDEI